MSSANFDDVIKLCSLFIKGATELLEAREKAGLYLHGNGHMHGGGEGIVRALAAIDMVVGVNGSL